MPLPLMLSVGAGPAGSSPLPVGICSVSSVQSIGDVASLTMSHTHAAPCDQILLWVYHYDQFITVTSATFNGISFTQIDQVVNTRAGILINPPVGTFDITITMSPARRSVMAAISLHGFDFTNAVMTASGGFSTTPSHTVASAVGEYVFDFVVAEPPDTNPVTWTIGPGQSQLFAQTNPSPTHQVAAASYEAGATSTTMSWTVDRNSFWGLKALSGVKGIPPPPGGGTVPPCIGPADGLVPINPLTYIHIRTVAGGHYYFGVTQLNDDDDWHGGKKPGKLLDVSDIKHTLGKQGAFEGSQVTARIIDLDRQFRTLVATTPLRGSCFEVFWVDDDVRRAKLEPFRLFSGTLTDHRGVTGYIYELTAHDTLAAKLAVINQQPTIPPDRLTAAVFPGLDPAIEGHAAPIVVGHVSDQNSSNPQGVVPPKFLGGPLNFQAVFGGINHDVDVYLLSKGALPANGVWEGYYNDPGDPSVRLVIPGSAWGSVIWAPGKPGWSQVGVATDYIDYNGERYTPFFVSRTLGALADAVKDGRVLVAFNLYGAENVGDGSGSTIDSPAKIWQWLLTNYVFTRYRTGLYAAVPSAACVVCVINTDSVDDAHDAQVARLAGGYISGFVLGRDGSPQAVFDVLGELCQGADMDQGINRHGELMLSVEDIAALGVMTFDPYDVEDGTYETWVDTQQLVNRVEQEYGYLYVPPVAPAPTPAVGDPVPSKPLKEPQKWASGLTITQDLVAQAAINEIVPLKLKNFVIRDQATADSVATHILFRGLGATGEGPRMFRFRGGPWLLGLNGSPAIILELGSVFYVSHPEKIGVVATDLDKCRILTITYHPLKRRVTYEGRVIGGPDWVPFN